MTPLVPFDTIYSLLYNWAQSSEVTVEYLQKPNMPNKNPGNFENSWKLIIANTLTDLAFSYATFPGATGAFTDDIKRQYILCRVCS